MIFKGFPNPRDLPALRGFVRPDETIVVHDRSDSASYQRHKGPLSLKAVLSGRESYDVHGFFEEVTADDFLVVNADQYYQSRIDADRPVESVSIFFSARDVAELQRLALPETRLIDDPSAGGPNIEFVAIKRALPSDLGALVKAIPGLRYDPKLAQQETAMDLLAAMFRSERAMHQDAAYLENGRPSAQAEMFRRCSIARAFMAAHFCDDLSLPQIAGVAELSRGHFVRSFTRFFGEPPSVFQRRLRMERATALLLAGESVSSAAVDVGYSNLSAFSRAFKAHAGMSPARVRQRITK